ncbi:MAG: 5-oxoprolinase (ATP-hydrolyzing) [Myxococcota bacterium]
MAHRIVSRTCVDRGGTFTDIVTIDASGVSVRKVPSDGAVIGDYAVGALTVGTTVATNAALTRTGAKVTVFITLGFAGLVETGDMTRRALFDPDAAWPALPVRECVEVCERVHWDGSVATALVLPDLPSETPESIAIVLLNSSRNPAHEDLMAAWLRSQYPHTPICVGHTLSPGVGLLARLETTVLDAAMTPLLRHAFARDRLPEGTQAIRSDASLCDASQLRAPDALLSGPAGGVLAVKHVARLAGFAHAVGLDMGGTSTDVCRVDVDSPIPRTAELRIAGLRVRRPSVDVHTIAAGGGSVASHRSGQLCVGPESAGANPGPQCYGRGGPPTVTDAALALGWMDGTAFDPPLDASKVSLPDRPEAIVDLAQELMAHAVEALAVQRGVSLTDHALVAYGGAAGQHAAGVAQRLGIRTVLVHPLAAVLSAFGQLMASVGEEVSRAVWLPLNDAIYALPDVFDALHATLSDFATTESWVRVRVHGTDHAVRLPWSSTADICAAYHAHSDVSDAVPDDAPLEVVDAIVVATTPGQALPSITDDPFHLGTTRINGPHVLTTPTTSIVVPVGWCAHWHDGLLHLTHEQVTDAQVDTATDAHGAALWGARFMATATQGGERLRRLARSVNIRERLDFSCAVFDSNGRLIANAPHIPVHLGAMGACVRDLIQHVPHAPGGSAWLTNDPTVGGSHLPDLTVITPVDHDGERFFVASRGHHVDVGGISPGSMPSRSTTLSEEGVVFRRVRIDVELPTAALEQTRAPVTVAADLHAQIAANRFMAKHLKSLGPASQLTRWMHTLRGLAEQAVRECIQHLPLGHAEDVIGGIAIRLSLYRDGQSLAVDFTGTGGPHAGNLNAPKAVVQASVLYWLRVLVGCGMPLNDGALTPISLRIPEPSVLSPLPNSAVAGGNVETSQRIVDLLFRAIGHRAGSQGTMNNLTIGGVDWAHYETLGGGQGASINGGGQSARQVHMTNTRATDPEVLEARTPLRVECIARRTGSGGQGEYCGGDGLIRELSTSVACTATLLATRRTQGARGIHAGDGQPARDSLCRGGEWEAWDGEETQLQPGDRIRVETPGGGGWSA